MRIVAFRKRLRKKKTKRAYSSVRISSFRFLLFIQWTALHFNQKSGPPYHQIGLFTNFKFLIVVVVDCQRIANIFLEEYIFLVREISCRVVLVIIRCCCNGCIVRTGVWELLKVLSHNFSCADVVQEFFCKIYMFCTLRHNKEVNTKLDRIACEICNFDCVLFFHSP